LASSTSTTSGMVSAMVNGASSPEPVRDWDDWGGKRYEFVSDRHMGLAIS